MDRFPRRPVVCHFLLLAVCQLSVLHRKAEAVDHQILIVRALALMTCMGSLEGLVSEIVHLKHTHPMATVKEILLVAACPWALREAAALVHQE